MHELRRRGSGVPSGLSIDDFLIHHHDVSYLLCYRTDTRCNTNGTRGLNSTMLRNPAGVRIPSKGWLGFALAHNN